MELLRHLLWKGCHRWGAGTLKRIVYNDVKSRNVMVKSAADFHDVCVAAGSSVSIVHVEESAITTFWTSIEDEIQSAAKVNRPL